MTLESRTRERLLATAIHQFGRDGYDAVSIRGLADSASVNVASIKYHFGGKEELYVAALDEIIAVMGQRVAKLSAVLEQGKRLAGEDPQRRADLVRQFVGALVQVFLGHPDVRVFLPLALRELFNPGPHFDRLYNAVSRHLHEAVTDLVAWVVDEPPDSPAMIIRAHALIGQIIVFQIGREILIRRLELKDEPLDIAAISHELSIVILRSLGLPEGTSP
jgi:AcrR family transcriptional regulator